MSEALRLRQNLEAELKAGLATVTKLGPVPSYVEHVHVPGKPRPAKMIFKLTKRQGIWLEYTANCPRCRNGKITAQTEMGRNGRSVWPPRLGFPTLCISCEEIPVPLVKRDDIWAAALDQQRSQRQRQQ